jgi:hypothetical protein
MTVLAQAASEQAAAQPGLREVSGKKLGTIFNNDINNILCALDGKNATADDYRHVLRCLLAMKPGVLAQNVGLPDTVIYRTKVATTFDKYVVEVSKKVWPKESDAGAVRQRDLLSKLLQAGTDPLKLTIEACRAGRTLIVASYRMNAEDWYQHTYLLSDFGRAHPEYRIPGKGCLDPAIPAVYDHRMKIFTEVVSEYDIDGIEFDFRRWYHMVSDPLKNHGVLTRMVRDTRKVLDETAKRKGRKKLILGVRVGPSLNSEPNPFIFPGIFYPQKPTNASCRELGLDVKTWIAEGLVDYVCPSLFLASLPGMPLTREFVELAKGTDVGIYPTLWPLAAWMHGVCERRVDLGGDQRPLALYKHDLCATALKMYEDGADGISTFNWYSHLRDAKIPHLWTDGEGASGSGAEAVQTYVYPLLRDPAAIRRYLAEPWALPPK